MARPVSSRINVPHPPREVPTSRPIPPYNNCKVGGSARNSVRKCPSVCPRRASISSLAPCRLGVQRHHRRTSVRRGPSRRGALPPVGRRRIKRTFYSRARSARGVPAKLWMGRRPFPVPCPSRCRRRRWRIATTTRARHPNGGWWWWILTWIGRMASPRCPGRRRWNTWGTSRMACGITAKSVANFFLLSPWNSEKPDFFCWKFPIFKLFTPRYFVNFDKIFVIFYVPNLNVFEFLKKYVHQLIDWLIDKSNWFSLDWLIDWRIEWLFLQLIDRLIDWYEINKPSRYFFSLFFWGVVFWFICSMMFCPHEEKRWWDY